MNDDQFEQLLTSLGERRLETKQSAFERHAQTALTSLIVLILAGFGGAMFKISDVQNDQFAELKVMQYQISELTKTIQEATDSFVDVHEFNALKFIVDDHSRKIEKYHSEQ